MILPYNMFDLDHFIGKQHIKGLNLAVLYFVN